MKILVGGVYADGMGYPNARNTIRLLRERLRLQVVDCAERLPSEEPIWKLTTRSRSQRVVAACRISFACFRSVFKVLRLTERSRDVVYVPYPSLPFMLVMAFVPRRWRPRCVVDAYILIWDTVVNDRRLLGEASMAAKLLYAAERRALGAATSVLVDTQAHKGFLCERYGLSENRIHAFPLAIDEPDSVSTQPHRSDRTDRNSLHVLFVGTFVPLQGTRLIARAIDQLKDDASIKFRVVGDGQESPAFASQTSSCLTNLSWHRGWMDKDALLKEVEDSDVCLGIFGNSPKAARVLPLKIYLYAACGKTVVSQDCLSVPENVPVPPMILINATDESALVRTLSALAREKELRVGTGVELAKYYRQYLSNEAIAVRWETMLQDLQQAATM